MGKTVGFVGLDEISLDLAASLLRSAYSVQAFDETSSQLMNEFIKLGGKRCANLIETKQGVDALITLISHADQINYLFYGDDGVLKGLPKDVIIIIHSTILPVHIEKLEKSLTEDYQIESIVDMYALKAVSEVSNGKVMIISSGRSESISRAEPFLSAMGDKLFLFEGDIGAGSKTKMVIELLEGIHFVASLEAISLGAQAQIHPWIIYDIISNAAGNSWVFKNYIPNLLRSNPSTSNLFCALNQNMGIVLEMAKSLIFPLPLMSVAHQQILAGCSHSVKDAEDTTMLQVWEELSGANITGAVNAKLYNPEELAEQLSAKSKPAKRIGFIGLGAMGFGMATHLLKSNFTVLGYDVYKPSLSRFENEGGIGAINPAEASKDVDVLVLMVTNEYQAESVLFGENGAVAALPSGATVILSSTVSPAFVRQLERRLLNEQTKVKLVDAPVSGGVKRAADGTLTVMASGTDEALEHAGSVLSALSEKLYIINGGCGAGSGVKMINQLLAGVHIASAAEALAFGARLSLNTSQLFDVITISAGTSWMFENRGPHMVENDYTPLSALDIFVKDLGIVSREGSSHKVPLHLSNGAHQLFLSGSAAGWGRIDDSAVVKVYETLTGVKVEGKPRALSKKKVLGSLPPEWSTDPIEDIISLNQKNSKTLIVLDDDPTGTQTVHDIDVLAEWSTVSLVEQFGKRSKCFFILTNSRSMSSEKASALIKEICSNLSAAAKTVDNAEYTVVLRGDSTLRGHFPEEADAAVSVIGAVDAWIICPFFLQGGRYTIGDVHYVADGDSLIPAGETEFAKDASFGYRSSNLREWVEEKTRGRIAASSVASISIQLLRKGGPQAVCEHLCSLKKGSTCIVNAASERDMAVFAAGMIQAELKGRSFLCRTAASFVSTRVGIISKAPVLPRDLIVSRERVGGLIVVGSYVPKTTKQVEELLVQRGHALKIIEVSVDKIAAKSIEEREQEITQSADMANVYLKGGKDTLILTSRQLVVGKTASESLEINCRVSSGLVEIVRRITTRPRYILAKGGITSSDLATKALEAKRARVVGQALAGIPLWQLGPESKHPGIPYIVFPGNVGDNKAVAEVVINWAHPGRLSAKELLLNAEKGGYAIGAFNVYNLEGVQAVVAAAEEQRSPAILQIHPSAFKQGGLPLVASCIYHQEARDRISAYRKIKTTHLSMRPEGLCLWWSNTAQAGLHRSHSRYFSSGDPYAHVSIYPYGMDAYQDGKRYTDMKFSLQFWPNSQPSKILDQDVYSHGLWVAGTSCVKRDFEDHHLWCLRDWFSVAYMKREYELMRVWPDFNNPKCPNACFEFAFNQWLKHGQSVNMPPDMYLDYMLQVMRNIPKDFGLPRGKSMTRWEAKQHAMKVMENLVFFGKHIGAKVYPEFHCIPDNLKVDSLDQSRILEIRPVLRRNEIWPNLEYDMVPVHAYAGGDECPFTGLRSKHMMVYLPLDGRYNWLPKEVLLV